MQLSNLRLGTRIPFFQTCHFPVATISRQRYTGVWPYSLLLLPAIACANHEEVWTWNRPSRMLTPNISFFGTTDLRAVEGSWVSTYNYNCLINRSRSSSILRRVCIWVSCFWLDLTSLALNLLVCREVRCVFYALVCFCCAFLSGLKVSHPAVRTADKADLLEWPYVPVQ